MGNGPKGCKRYVKCLACLYKKIQQYFKRKRSSCTCRYKHINAIVLQEQRTDINICAKDCDSVQREYMCSGYLIGNIKVLLNCAPAVIIEAISQTPK